MRPPRLLVRAVVLAGCSAAWGCPVEEGDDAADGATLSRGGTTEAMASAGTSVDGPTGDGTGGGACFVLPACDPLAPGCSGTDKCVPDDGGFVCTATPDGIEELGAGEACSGALSCAAGLACMPISLPGCVGAEGCCVALCELSAPQCDGSTVCTPLFDAESSLCYDELGVCTVS